MDTYVPTIIDIEASGFGRDSYPIEVGIAFADGHKFCRLVKPEGDWTYWDAKAEAVHGITRKHLEKNGNSVAEVANQLNQLLQGITVYSDCWTVDKPWLDRLFRAANVRQDFQVRAIEMILSENQLDHWNLIHSYNISQNQELRHRASKDAELIQKTWRDTRSLSESKRMVS